MFIASYYVIHSCTLLIRYMYLLFKSPGEHGVNLIQHKSLDMSSVKSVTRYHVLHTTWSPCIE